MAWELGQGWDSEMGSGTDCGAGWHTDTEADCETGSNKDTVTRMRSGRGPWVQPVSQTRKLTGRHELTGKPTGELAVRQTWDLARALGWEWALA